MQKFKVSVEFVNWSDVKDVKSSVYMMINDCMSGVYSIGYNEHETLKSRIKSLEKSEWVMPGSLKYAVVVDTDCPELLAHKMHFSLSESRISDEKDLFYGNFDDIFKKLSVHAMGFANKIYVVKDIADVCILFDEVEKVD
jgi:hypothetical protein